jgi:hypothetical protein
VYLLLPHNFYQLSILNAGDKSFILFSTNDLADIVNTGLSNPIFTQALYQCLSWIFFRSRVYRAVTLQFVDYGESTHMGLLCDVLQC